jgi:type VI secretion system protein ImpK
MAQPPDDPMGGGDRTILRPGGTGARRPAAPAPTPAPVSTPPPLPTLGPAPARGAAPVLPSRTPATVNIGEFLSSGNNPLLQTATPLLVLAQRLRGTVAVPDVGGLRNQVIEEIRNFENRARGAGASAEDVLAARYALCSALDEAVLNTPWGAQSEWAGQTMLVVFHREAFGGEKFFLILERLMADPPRYIDLMELMYACIVLGFEGRYRLDERGAARLADVQRDLYQRIQMQRGAVPADLSPRWQGLTDRRNRVARFVPVWIVALGALAILVVTFVFLYARLGSHSEPVMSSLSRIGLEPMYAKNAGPSAGPRLKALLAPQELSGELRVDEQADRTIVTLPEADMFASGSATVNPRYAALLNAIGQALNRVQGRVTVVGHTDNQALTSLRFANNNELSRARALAVVTLLGGAMNGTGRLEAVGRGSDEPRYTPPDLPQNRARNRRVEIVQRAGL